MKKVLIICGPTAVGKTSLAIHLIKLLSVGSKTTVGEIVSVDSRQVYQQMDIGTGKDLPAGSKLVYPESELKRKGIGCYEISGVRIWGYDLVSPKKDFSVSDYSKKAIDIIKNIIKRGQMPVLVGGSGLYLKALIDGIPTASIPRDDNLRKFLSLLPASELFEKLAQLDSEKAASLNFSDRKNPRRLIRAIEIAQWKIKNSKRKFYFKLPWDKSHDFLFLGLFAPRELLKEKIKKRVYSRYKAGFKKEVLNLLKNGVSWNFHSMDTLGYKNMKDFVLKRISKEDMLNSWMKDEFAYAKRQMTWFKKEKRIIWFDISQKKWLEKVDKLVKKWYTAS
jgi:tRNA dimethylallyltransferase